MVGGVSQLYQGDLDFGRVGAERLSAEDLGRIAVVEDFHYGAVAVAQRLEELAPDALILLGAAARGRPPGTLERRRVHARDLPREEVQGAIADAVTGYVTVDLAIAVASGLGALPERTVAIELEPASIEPSERLSPTAASKLETALALVRAEVERAPLFALAERLRLLAYDDRLEPSEALAALHDVLAELKILDDDGRWGATFGLRDRLRTKIAAGETGYGMDHLDWGLWWALIEELDRLEALEAFS